MTTNKSNHANCLHPKTKAARAACRKSRAAWDALNAEWAAEREADRLAAEPERIWNEEFPKFCEAHQGSAHQNADDTAHEEGFEPYSPRWYECATSTLHHARDCAEHVMNPYDPEPGQSLMIAGGTDYLWVESVTWGQGVASEIRVVDREGIRSVIKPQDIETY
jgi:hypothetical protein